MEVMKLRKKPTDLAGLLDADHPLLLLAARIDWRGITDGSMAGRRMAGLHALKFLRGLSDGEVCAQWLENPYFQAFSGESVFWRHLPFGPPALQDWRNKLGQAELQSWLAQLDPSDQAEKPATFVIDVDGVVALLTPGNDYRLCQPISEAIEAINRLYERGHRIIMLTARGSGSGLDWADLTRQQFADWGLKYHELRFGKPAADYYIDDRSLDIDMMYAMARGRTFPPSSLAPRLPVLPDEGPEL